MRSGSAFWHVFIKFIYSDICIHARNEFALLNNPTNRMKRLSLLTFIIEMQNEYDGKKR